MNTSTLIMVIIAAGMLIYAFTRSEGLAILGLKISAAIFWNNLALLISGFVIAGLMQVLLPKDLISTWLGKTASFKAVIIGCIAGGIIPGSPYAVFPIVAGLYISGAGLGAVIGFITAWSLWSVTRLVTEVSLINPKIALIRYGITFIIPPIAGLVAHILDKTIL